MGCILRMVRGATYLDDVTGPGLFTKDDLPSDRCVMAVPHALIMHPATSKARITAALGCEDEQETLVMRDWILLDLVLHRLLDGKESQVAGDVLQLAPYVRILPAAFGTPLECKPAEIALLDGTSLFNGTVQRLQKTSDAAERSKAWLTATCAAPRLASDPAAEVFRAALESDWLSLWRWADDVYGSRSFPASIAGWTVPPASLEPVLIPGIDSINHRRAYPVTWEHVHGAASLIVRAEIPAGTQIFNNYGAKSNEELFSSYGFVQPGGPDDVLVLALRRGEDEGSQLYYWQKSQADPPSALLDALRTQMPSDEADARIASLLQEAQVCEALEQFIRSRLTAFHRTQEEVDDTMPWMLEDESDGVREPILETVREYRQGRWCRLQQVKQHCSARVYSGRRASWTRSWTSWKPLDIPYKWYHGIRVPHPQSIKYNAPIHLACAPPTGPRSAPKTGFSRALYAAAPEGAPCPTETHWGTYSAAGSGRA